MAVCPPFEQRMSRLPSPTPPPFRPVGDTGLVRQALAPYARLAFAGDVVYGARALRPDRVT
jgi:hypothetical protein